MLSRAVRRPVRDLLCLGRLHSATLHPALPSSGASATIATSTFVRSLPWFAIVLAAVATMAPLWEPGALAGHSAWYDLTRLTVFDAAIRAGDWWPAWSSEFYHGHGSPLFQFYAPLSYYLAELPVLAGADYATALKLTQALALIASGLAMHALVLRHVSRWAAGVAAVLYMVAPYRFVDLYVRHALAEHCAFVWLPLIVLGIERAVAKRSRGGLLLGAFATAALILTHNITVLIGLPICVAASWALGTPAFSWASIWRAIVPAILGIGLAAFFWWPAMAGSGFTHGPEVLTAGYFDPRENFVSPARLLTPGWGFGGSTEAEPDTMSVQIGVIHLLAGLGAVLLLRRTRFAAVGVATMALAAMLCLAISRPLWDALPILRYAQFPWRFLGLVVFGAAMCGAASVERLNARHRALACTAVLIAILVVYAPCYRDAWYLAFDTKAESVTRVRGELLRAGLATGRLAPLASVLTPETVRQSGERGTSIDDFLPRGVVEKPHEPAPEPIVVSHHRPLAADASSAGSGQRPLVHFIDRLAPTSWRATVSLTEPGRVELRQFWFPGWTATVDARPVECTPSGPSALVSCAVPTGEHVVEFRYTSLPQRRTGVALSLLAGASLCFVLRGRR